MKTILIIAALMLAGCSTTTVPVKAKFPDIPNKLLEPCPQLQQLKEDAKLSDVSKTVTVNYTTYYECATKHDGIIEWYKVQRIIFEK